MNFLWQRFTAALTPGVKSLLALLALVYLADSLGRLTGLVELKGWLAVSAPQFWHGQVWRIVTYALLPMGLMDFAMNAFALILLGSMLERHWTRRQLWSYCAIAAAGAGMAAVALLPQFIGTAPATFGLLVAWAFECGHEILLFPLFGHMTARQMALIFAIASLLVMAFSGGLLMAVVMAAGGLTGGLYLWLHRKWQLSRPGHTVHSGRINRLEL